MKTNRHETKLVIANRQLALQHKEKKKRAGELVIANKELAYQQKEKKNRAKELVIADKELFFEKEEKGKRAAELIIANKELRFQNKEKENRAAELIIANKELKFQNREKEKRAKELIAVAKKLITSNNTLILQVEERELAEQTLLVSQSNLRAIIDNTDATIYSLDKKLNYITFNNHLKVAMKNIYGLNIKAGTSIYEVLKKFTKEEAQSWKTVYARALKGETITFENKFEVSRLISYTYFSIHPIWENKSVIGLSCFVRDITQQKQDDLDKEKIVAELIQHIKDLEQFSYIVSHNLRAPLANIMGSAGVLNNAELADADKKDCLNILQLSVKKLDDVIKDLNHILQVKREISEIKTTVLFSEMLENIKVSINHLVAKNKIHITGNFTEVNKMLTVKSYLHSIFYNLISNSIKYRRPRTITHINITALKQNNSIVLLFKDNGLGIDLEQRGDQVFGLYKRFHLHTEGKGMGSFMVKTQVETLGGKITIKSSVNKGTEFRIEFGI